MVIVTVTKWKQKLFFLLAALVVIVGMSLAVSNVAPSSGELKRTFTPSLSGYKGNPLKTG